MDHEHRWLRHQDPETGARNHWCIDGDTEHHGEPCADADHRAGEHANDSAGLDVWPVHQDVQA